MANEAAAAEAKPVLSPTAALARLKVLQEQFQALGLLGEILAAAQACEDPAARLAELEEKIATSADQLNRLDRDLGSAREGHQKLMAELGRDESQRRLEIENGLSKARSEAATAINLAKESQARAEAEHAEKVKEMRGEIEALQAELDRVRRTLSELKGSISA